MNAVVAYDSKFGNTEELAKAIAQRLAATRLVSTAEAGTFDLAGVDLLVVGGPTQVHGVSPALRELLDRLPDDALQGVSAAAFDTRFDAARLLTGSAAMGIARRLKSKGARLLVRPESFFVTTDKGPLAEGEVARARTWAAALLARTESDREPAAAR
jgi:flavodoxin